jgi:hypothetical protein
MSHSLPSPLPVPPRVRRRGHPPRWWPGAVLLLLASSALPHGLGAQVTGTAEALSRGLEVTRLVAEPATLVLVRGESALVRVRALDASGAEVDAVVRVTGPRRGIQMTPEGVRGVEVGEWHLTADVALPPGAGEGPRLEIPVLVEYPAVTEARVLADPGRLYQGTTLRHRATGLHADGTERPRPTVEWRSSDPSVAEVDRLGNVTGVGTGRVTITARVEGVEAAAVHEVAPFPAERLEIQVPGAPLRTGDAVPLRVRALASSGEEVPDLPISLAYLWDPGDRELVAPGAAALLREGYFAAEIPGEYTLLAVAGPLTTRTVVEVEPREVVQRVSLLGQGRVSEYHTSDFWVWEGVDGRDYAISGTWGADGWAYLWDVTDPGAMVKTDSVRVDARTVNDVKTSPDGRYATLTREGASNRRNGLVLLDLASEPGRMSVAAVVDDGLTGGVHNAYPTNDHVYALSGGEKYVIIDVRDLRSPRVVSEVQHGDCRIHDVWVHDGLAYSAQWACGLLVHDVGNGAWGGTPEAPVLVSQFRTPGGRTHAVFPYVQEETGIVYVYLGDEIIGRDGMAWGGQPTGPFSPATEEEPVPEQTAGYVHIVDFSDPAHPRKVARYEVPEYGTHNIWVEDDVLYQAYYEGGLRVVDVSGELRGNLATQGREVAVFKPFDPFGHIRNAPMVWSAMPFKGRIFLSDHNSGLWSVELQPREEGRPVS